MKNKFITIITYILIFFNSNLLHAGSNPIKNDVRIVVNSILEVEN